MTDWSGLAVVAVPWTPGSARLVARAREMANSLGAFLRVVTPAAAPAGAVGADEVLTSDKLDADRLARWAREAAPEIILFEDSPAAARAAGRLAGLLQAPILEGVSSIDLDLNDRSLLMRLETYGSRQLEEWAATPDARPQIALVKSDRLAEPCPEARDPEVRPLP